VNAPATITDLLLRFTHTSVPDDATEMMRLSLFDWAACGIAGARDEAFPEVVDTQVAMSPGSNTVLGGGTSSAPTAALINGMLSHALDYDDTHFAHIGHPSVAVVPCVLALAEDIGADLDAMVAAAAVGVEASVLVGLWLGREHYQIGYHQTATAGAFGAVMGAVQLLGLDATQARHALGLCATMASGLKSQFGTMGKPLNAGLAARCGVEAALWAQAGVTGAQDGLAGPLGFGPTHHGAMQDVKLPGKRWRILDISHKFHACCHGLHAMLEAVQDTGLPASEIEAVHIRTHPRWMSVCNIEAPETGLAAKFSYKQTAAMALLGHDTSGIENFTDAITRDAEVIALRDRIQVSEEARLGEMQAEVSVTLAGGSIRRLRHDLAEPNSTEARSMKLRAKAKSLIGSDHAAALWDSAQGSSLRAFTTAISGTATPPNTA